MKLPEDAVISGSFTFSQPSNRDQKMADNKSEDVKARETKAADAKGGKMPSRRKTYIALILLISGFILVWKQYIEPTYLAEYRAPSGKGNVKVESVGLPSIGGPFTLVDQDGKTVSEADFKGSHMLVYFGYTYCPDVCPTSLSAMAGALDILGDKADKITPVFITIDPERDDPEALKSYIEHFHPRLVGLTGTPGQIKAAAKGYKAYYAKVGDGYEQGDYSMDHSSITYLMGPDGNFVTHFGHGVESEPMAKKLAELL